VQSVPVPPPKTNSPDKKTNEHLSLSLPLSERERETEGEREKEGGREGAREREGGRVLLWHAECFHEHSASSHLRHHINTPLLFASLSLWSILIFSTSWTLRTTTSSTSVTNIFTTVFTTFFTTVFYWAQISALVDNILNFIMPPTASAQQQAPQAQTATLYQEVRSQN